MEGLILFVILVALVAISIITELSAGENLTSTIQDYAEVIPVTETITPVTRENYICPQVIITPANPTMEEALAVLQKKQHCHRKPLPRLVVEEDLLFDIHSREQGNATQKMKLNRRSKTWRTHVDKATTLQNKREGLVFRGTRYL